MLGILFLTLVCSALGFTALGPISQTPGVSERCNRTEACFPFSKQEQFSLIWLCCEDDNGWVSAHFLLPLGTYLFTHSVTLTFLQILFSEYIEATGLLLGGNFVFPVDENTKLETWTGSLFGDGTIGFLAVLTGFLMIKAFHVPPLWRSDFPRKMWWKYVGLWGGYGIFFLLHLWRTGPESSLNPGAILATGLLVVYLLGILPWLSWFGSKDVKYVWRNVRNAPYGLRKKSQAWPFFIAWALVVVACQVQTVGIQYLPNDWYQVLVSVALANLVFSLIWFARASRRGNRKYAK